MRNDENFIRLRARLTAALPFITAMINLLCALAKLASQLLEGR